MTATISVDEALRVIDAALEPDLLSNVQQDLIRYALEGKKYREIAEISDYDPSYIRDVGYKLWRRLTKAFGEPVTKKNLQVVIRRHSQTVLPKLAAPTVAATAVEEIDWELAIDTGDFVGRERELAQLDAWLADNRTRLIVLTGGAGSGKSACAMRWIERLCQQGDLPVLLRSLHATLTPTDLLKSWLHALTGKSCDAIADLDSLITQVLRCLRQRRYLLVLDGFESVFCPGRPAGTYADGMEGYDRILQKLTKEKHQSCLLIVSRELPANLLDEVTHKVHTLRLAGLDEGSTTLLGVDAAAAGAENTALHQISDYYGGNPTALLTVSQTIRDLFGGSIPSFLAHGLGVYGAIRQLFDRQWERLTFAECLVMYWLALQECGGTMVQLLADLGSRLTAPRTVEAMESLWRRSLVARQSHSFSLCPAWREYAIEQLAEHLCAETAEIFELLACLPLAPELLAVTEATDTTAVALLEQYLRACPSSRRDRLHHLLCDGERAEPQTSKATLNSRYLLRCLDGDSSPSKPPRSRRDGSSGRNGLPPTPPSVLSA